MNTILSQPPKMILPSRRQLSSLLVLVVSCCCIAVATVCTLPSKVQGFTIPSIPTVSYNSKYATKSTTTLNPVKAFLPKGKLSLTPSFLLRNDASPAASCMVLFAAASMKRIPVELEDVPIPFIDPLNESGSASSSSLKFIECYADCTAEINGIEYTIAIPCDYSVSLCYASENDPDELIPIEVTDTELMDDIFPIAESIVAEEYGEDLVLQRTPETLTLVGELELDDDEDDEDYDAEEEDDDDDEEEVDVLLSFEHRGKEYQLVRIRDPILLVGKKPTAADDTTATMETRLLLTKEESTEIMPTLEDMYLNYQKEQDEEEDESGDVDVDDVNENKVTEDDDALAMTAMDSEEQEEYVYNDDDEDNEYEDLVTFYDPQAALTNSLPTIDCYIDRVYMVDGVEYTIATPCDYVVTICTTEEASSDDDDDDDGALNPIDIEPDTTKIIDTLFPIMAKAVADEFDGEMTLTRTPQYMTLVGDVDLDDEDDDDDEEEEYDDDDEEEEEEVQVILTFDQDGTEYTLVREMEPMLLVGKAPRPEDLNDVVTTNMRILLDAKESDAVVPKLMEMYNDDEDDEEEA